MVKGPPRSGRMTPLPPPGHHEHTRVCVCGGDSGAHGTEHVCNAVRWFCLGEHKAFPNIDTYLQETTVVWASRVHALGGLVSSVARAGGHLCSCDLSWWLGGDQAQCAHPSCRCVAARSQVRPGREVMELQWAPALLPPGRLPQGGS